MDNIDKTMAEFVAKMSLSNETYLKILVLAYITPGLNRKFKIISTSLVIIINL